VDNTLKVLLGVLGFAGVLTALATTLNGPDEPVSPASVAVAPPPVSAPVADAPETPEELPEIVSDDELSDEDLASFDKPTIELPSDEDEAQAIADASEQDYGPALENGGPLPPPPPGAALAGQ
jgi:hypothetical protein